MTTHPRRRRDDADRPESPIGSPPNGSLIGLARTILSTSGPIALIAVGLTLFIAWYVWQRLDRIEGRQELIISALTSANINMSTYAARQTELERERLVRIDAQLRILRQTCNNTAKSEAQHENCNR